jgi:hypothetical protein
MIRNAKNRYAGDVPATDDKTADNRNILYKIFIQAAKTLQTVSTLCEMLSIFELFYKIDC